MITGQHHLHHHPMLCSSLSAHTCYPAPCQVTQWLNTERVVRIVLETYTKDINYLVKEGH